MITNAFKVVLKTTSLVIRCQKHMYCVQLMNGIATANRHMVDVGVGCKAQILETRKTAPGLRIIDKWAVLIGGGQNHRIGLYDMRFDSQCFHGSRYIG